MDRIRRAGRRRAGRWRTALAGCAMLVLAGCSTGGPTHEASRDFAGSVELAVSQSCVAGSGTDCVAVNDRQMVVSPSGFTRAGVQAATVDEEAAGPAVLVTFDAQGARVFQRMSAEVARSGQDARLVVKVDDSLLASVMVPEPMTVDRVQLSLPAGESPDAVVARIRDG